MVVTVQNTKRKLPSYVTEILTEHVVGHQVVTMGKHQHPVVGFQHLAFIAPLC